MEGGNCFSCSSSLPARVLLSFDLAFKSILWDETPHLYGALLLSQGRISEYLATTFYPPLFDIVTAGVFTAFGASLWVGRFVSVVFALLTLVVLFKLASKAYNRRVAFLSCIFLAVMPGFIWVARLSILEVALMFFLVAAFWLFLEWIHSGKDKVIVFCGLMLGCAFLIKYPALLAGLIIVVSLPLLLYHAEFKPKLSRFTLFLVGVAAIVIPVLAALTVSGGIAPWLSLLQINDAQANIYSIRFPIPIFYIIESTFPGIAFAHPISIGIFVLGALGVGLFALRRKPADRFFLVWLLVIYVFFTLIASRTWRYVLPLYPVVAVAGASFVAALYGKAEHYWKNANTPANRKLLGKVLAGCLIALTASAAIYSVVEAQRWVANETVYIPLPEATHYAAQRINGSDVDFGVVPHKQPQHKRTQILPKRKRRQKQHLNSISNSAAGFLSDGFQHNRSYISLPTEQRKILDAGRKHRLQLLQLNIHSPKRHGYCCFKRQFHLSRNLRRHTIPGFRVPNNTLG